MYGFGNLVFSVEDFINEAKRIINDKEEMERLTGNGLTKNENILLYLFDFIGDNTKFKAVELEHLRELSFKSKNRCYTIWLENNKIKMTYFVDLDSKYADAEKYANDTFTFNNFYELKNWLKKRNYLK
jgi:hypothetical protein